MSTNFPRYRSFIRAFTLIELLVVIGILGLLMGMILPAMGKAKGRARTVQCQANLKQLNLANASYTDANGEALPLAIFRPQPVGTPGEQIYSFDDQLYEYLGIRLTPAEQQASRIPIAKRSRLLTCPEDKAEPHPGFMTPETWRRTYSMSEANMGGINYGQPLLSLKDGGVGVYYSSFWGPSINTLLPAAVLREHQISSPQTTLLFVERPDSRNLAGNDHFSVTRGTSNQLYGIGGNKAKAYHGGRFVYSYCDGHMEVKEPKETWGRTGNVSPWAGDWTMRTDD
jgi:prepilin-type N-terminal cleavage/methylation domain-containing protein/prepilin-type processing-associated H-X9-DG protein